MSPHRSEILETSPQVENPGTVPREIKIWYTDPWLKITVKGSKEFAGVWFIPPPPPSSQKNHFNGVNQGVPPGALLN